MYLQSDRDSLERLIRASFSLSVGTIFRLATKMSKIRAKKEKE